MYLCAMYLWHRRIGHLNFFMHLLQAKMLSEEAVDTVNYLKNHPISRHTHIRYP